MRTVLIVGGDGFCGWPIALHLSKLGYRVASWDSLYRRRIDSELGIESLIPICSPQERVAAWHEISGQKIEFQPIEVNSFSIRDRLADLAPNVVVHLAEIKSAPYSMRTASHRERTLLNNLSVTHTIANAIADVDPTIHLIHFGTMGVYGYGELPGTVPEGFLDVQLPDGSQQVLPYPTNPGSLYHLSKCLDQEVLRFYSKAHGIKITELHQGIVWGTQTDDTLRDDH